MAKRKPAPKKLPETNGKHKTNGKAGAHPVHQPAAPPLSSSHPSPPAPPQLAAEPPIAVPPPAPAAEKARRRERWVEIEAARLRQIRKLRRIERAGWQAWNASRRAAEEGEEESKSASRNRQGDPRYLAIILRSVNACNSLFGFAQLMKGKHREDDLTTRRNRIVALLGEISERRRIAAGGGRDRAP